ncbi:ribosome maturation factor RimM [uncultured Muribaculum sp.]|uniref:ribosome maturation factor RimM n=1 Tax=uncultured Muribaculum sp. TaxID=1918613 RepID=UPI0025E9089B|nr:ribosome maturation factor RimM [uncultured Muribaculum sp.]
MITADQLIEIGHFGKPHGINGELNAYVDADIDADAMKRIVLMIDGIYVPFFIGSIRQKRHDTFIVALDDISNEHEASELTNRQIFVLKADGVLLDDEADAEPDGLYASDLVGYNVTDDSDGHTIGTVEDIDDSTDNVLFIIATPDGDTVYLPVADEFITSIDTDTRTLCMSLPDGILDL